VNTYIQDDKNINENHADLRIEYVIQTTPEENKKLYMYFKYNSPYQIYIYGLNDCHTTFYRALLFIAKERNVNQYWPNIPILP